MDTPPARWEHERVTEPGGADVPSPRRSRRPTCTRKSPRAGAPLSIEELDLDEPRADEILVRVEAVGVWNTVLTFPATS